LSNFGAESPEVQARAVVNTFVEMGPGVLLERRGHRHKYPGRGEHGLRDFHGFYIGPTGVLIQSA
jgi:hypothetical protein